MSDSRNVGHAGIYVPSIHGIVEENAVVADEAVFGRFSPSRNLRVTSIAFVSFSASGADDAVDVGIYDSGLTKIVSSGATTGKLTGTGVKSVSINPTDLIANNVYYIGLSSGTQGGAAGSLMTINLGHAALGDLFGVGVGGREFLYKTSAHPLPAGPVSPTGAKLWCPVMAVRE